MVINPLVGIYISTYKDSYYDMDEHQPYTASQNPSRYDISPKVGVLTWFIHPEMGIYSQYSMKYPQKEFPKLCGEDGDAMFSGVSEDVGEPQIKHF